MKFSIIIPCHNIENYIGYCLKTILDQTYTDYEVICICDKCTDHTKEIIENMSDIKIKIYESYFGCAGLPRNIGLDHAIGEWVWFIDGDDWLVTPFALETLAIIIDRFDNIDLINFNFIWGNNIYRILDNNGKMWCNVWSRIFKRSSIGDIRFNDKIVGEDLDFFLSFNKEKRKLYDLDKPFYFYNNPRLGSISFKNQKQIEN